MGTFYSQCCHPNEKEEKNAILCNTSASSGREVQLECATGLKQNRTSWKAPLSSSSIIDGESDQELQAFLMMRNQVDEDTENHSISTAALNQLISAWIRDSFIPQALLGLFSERLGGMHLMLEEWEKLNYDIHTLKCARREVCSRWKKILLLLGYQMEVDLLLAVNKQSILRDGEHVERARELLDTVCEESNLFPRGVEPNDRYLHVMDRLVSLDNAEDFVRLAKEKYPKTDS